VGGGLRKVRSYWNSLHGDRRGIQNWNKDLPPQPLTVHWPGPVSVVFQLIEIAHVPLHLKNPPVKEPVSRKEAQLIVVYDGHFCCHARVPGILNVVKSVRIRSTPCQ
jgi:hypothetical protein